MTMINVKDKIADGDFSPLNDVVTGSVDFKGRTSVRSKSGCWKSASFIILSGVAERFAYYGISANMVSYLTGNLGQSTAAAASTLNAWFGTASLLPILGAFIADSFLGRFRMIIVSCVLYVLGLSFLSLSASYHSSDTPEKLQLTFFYFSIYLVALAQGGLTPCVQAFGADQFDEDEENERSSKSSFFNWWYCFASGGILVPLFVLNYIQENVSWVLGFGVPAVVMCLTLVVFIIGCPTYRYPVNANGANPFARIFRVFAKSVRNWQAVDTDTAVISIEEGLLCSQLSANDVEDAKSILRLVPVWCASLGYSIVYAQPATLFTKQVSTIDRHITPSFEIPAASFQCFITLTIVVGLPLYDRVLVPAASAITKKPSGISMLQRISFGLFLSFTSIVFAAFVERKRLTTAEDFTGAVIPMSIWWFAPQYVLAGVADVFAMVGLQEFFYDQIPNELKSVGLAMYLSILGVGSLLSSFLVSTIQRATSGNGSGGWFSDNLNRAHLDYFYWVLAGISALGLVSFVYFTRSYIYRRRIIL